MSIYTQETYLSPFTWRYGSEAMRALWSEVHKRRLWRRIWVALATAQAEAGLVKPEQVGGPAGARGQRSTGSGPKAWRPSCATT